MADFDFYDTEAGHLSEIGCEDDGFDDKLAIEYSLWNRHREVNSYNKKVKEHRLKCMSEFGIGKDDFIIICDARSKNKFGNTLMYVDRRKNKAFWWTHDLSIVLHGTQQEMSNVVSQLKFNNPRVISVKKYLSV